MPLSGRLILGQAWVVPHDQVAVDFLHEIQGDADDDEQAGAAVEAGDRVVDFQRGRNQAGNDGDDGEERRARRR